MNEVNIMIDSYNFYACHLFLSSPHETKYGICVTNVYSG